MNYKDSTINFALTVPGFYDPEELSRLYDLVHALPDKSTIVEIGVQYGRTASLYLSERRHNVYLIDCWVENEGDAVPFFSKMVLENVWQGQGLWGRSDEVVDKVPDSIDLLHIDGGHTPEVVWKDCELYLPKVKVDGVVVFHDYQRPGADPTTGSVFPGVDKAIDYHLTKSYPQWLWHMPNVVTQVVATRIL